MSSPPLLYVPLLLLTVTVIIFHTPTQCLPTNNARHNHTIQPHPPNSLRSLLSLFDFQLSDTTRKFRCSSTSDCNTNYTCMSGLLQPCDPTSTGASSQCICFPSANNRYRCSSTAECTNDRICAGLPISSTGFCVSCNTFYSSTGLVAIGRNDCVFESNVCIDASLLSSFPSHRLVFPRHHQAYVLCDQHGSCATPGHVVVMNGVPMMMRTYCTRFSNCRRRIALVNSPRFKRALRIDSKTDGLVLTPFAAQYETSLEEHVLSTIIRLGM